MTISEKVTQEKFLEILVNTYIKGKTSENVKVNEMIEDIKQQILAAED